MSERVQNVATKIVKVLQETEPPPDVHLIIATSPVLTTRTRICNVVGLFIHQLHDLIINNFNLTYADEVFEKRKGVTVIIPKRRAGQVEMGHRISASLLHRESEKEAHLGGSAPGAYSEISEFGNIDGSAVSAGSCSEVECSPRATRSHVVRKGGTCL